MQARFIAWLNGIKAWWGDLDSRRKLAYTSAAAVVMLFLIAVPFVFARPNWQEIERFSSYADFQEYTTALSNEGIRHRTRGMTVSVRDADIRAASVTMTTHGRGSMTAWRRPDALGAMGMTASRAVIDMNTTALAQTEIEEMMVMINGITHAMAKLDMPQNPNNMFMRSGDSPTAAIVIHTNHLFDTNSGERLARLVASAVIGLELENIKIIDQNSNVIFDSEIGGADHINIQRAFESNYKSHMERGIQNVMAPSFQDVHVATNLFFDYSTIFTEMLQHTSPMGPDNPIGLLIRDHTIRSDDTYTDFADQPGMAANDLVIYNTGASGSGERSYFESTREFLQDFTHTMFEENRAGTIVPERSSATVTGVNNVHYHESLFNEGAYDNHQFMVPGMSWMHFKSVMPQGILVDVDPRIEEQLRLASGIDRVIIVAYLRPIFHDIDVSPVPVRDIIILTFIGIMIFTLAVMGLRRYKPAIIGDIEPELSVEDLLVSTQIDEDKEQELMEEERLREIKLQQDSETKQLIEKFIDARPEAAAQLLRNWLNEDWE